MKKRLALYAAILFNAILIPSAWAYAQTIVNSNIACTGWNCVLCNIVQVIQSVINFAIILAFPVAAVLIGWAGVLYFTSVANPSGIARARSILLDVVVGFVFMLCCYLIVDTLIHTLFVQGQGPYGNFANSWTSVQCVNSRPLGLSITQWLFGSIAAPSGGPTNNGNVMGSDGCPVGQPLDPRTSNCSDGTSPRGTDGCPTNAPLDPRTSNCADGSTPLQSTPSLPPQTGIGDCSPGALGSSFGSAASTMSCIAQVESTCNPSIPSGVDKGTDQKPVSFGTFQINISSNQLTCNGQTYNCPAAFNAPYVAHNANGTHVVNQALYDTCVSVATNGNCNIQTAQTLYSKAGLSPWRGDGAKCGF